jgi:hypothetical protein
VIGFDKNIISDTTLWEFMLQIYRMSNKSRAIGELGYLAEYGKMKEGKVVTNHVFPISSVQILYLRRAVTPMLPC